jgi:hypothetical protein
MRDTVSLDQMSAQGYKHLSHYRLSGSNASGKANLQHASSRGRTSFTAEIAEYAEEKLELGFLKTEAFLAALGVVCGELGITRALTPARGYLDAFSPLSLC